MDEDLEKYLKEARDIEIDNIFSIEQDEEYNKKVTLPPDHPLLEKFQQSLRKQLQTNIERITEELNATNIEIKKKTQERDILGVNVYEAQQLVVKQQETIESCEEEFKKIAQERQELEMDLDASRRKYQQMRDDLEQAERKDLELQNDIESINYMLLQMQQWEEELHSDLKINKRIAQRTKKDKVLFSEEKRNLDFIIYKLMTEIFRLEQNLEHCDMQLIAKEKEREELAELIAQSNADQEMLEAEHRRLMHSWNSVIVAINHRDKAYFAAKTELEDSREELVQSMKNIEIEKKICSEEMFRNEQLTIAKEQVELEKRSVASRLNSEMDKITSLDDKIEKVQAMLTSTLRDLDFLTGDIKAKESILAAVRRDWEKEMVTKVDLESKIINIAQEQLTNDKVTKYINKKIKELKELNRSHEINLASLENQNATVLVNVEKQKAQNESLQRYIDELNQDQQMKEQDLNKIMTDLHDNKYKIIRLLRTLDGLNKKLDEAINKAGGIELSPIETKIRTLEKQIAEGEERNKNLQIFWLRQQSYVVELSEKRQKQLSEMNLLRKQTLILEQKNLKLEDEMENLDTQERLMNREISNLQIKLDKFYTHTYKKRIEKQDLDNLTLTMQAEFDNELKNLELECIKLESTISDNEREKEQLSKDLIEISRDVMVWEKKFQMANETKKSIDEEKSAGGEIGAMQNEIHRMTVRYGQLKKAQDKLTQDLQYTLMRRENVWVAAESAEKRFAMGKTKTKVALQRKIETIREKIKKCQQEKNAIHEKIHNSNKLEDEMKEDIKYTTEEIEKISKEIDILTEKIENGNLEKDKIFEKVLFLQNQGKMKASIDNGSYKMLFKNPKAIDEEYPKELKKNAVLKNVIENLIVDFPHQKRIFYKILHTLQLPLEIS